MFLKLGRPGWSRTATGLCIFFSAIAMGSNASAFSVFEPVDGDLSGDIAAPTDLGVAELGANSIAGSVVNAGAVPGLPAQDIDIITFEVASGQQLSSLELFSFTSTDDLAFAAIASGTTFPVDPNTLAGGGDPNALLFLGGVLFGSGPTGAGNDLLPSLAAANAGGSGFSAPLGAGSYSFLVQQLGGATVDYRFVFETTVVPEPGTALLMGLGLLGLGAGRPRRS